jgi:hypothetical protein
VIDGAFWRQRLPKILCLPDRGLIPGFDLLEQIGEVKYLSPYDHTVGIPLAVWCNDVIIVMSAAVGHSCLLQT